MSRSRSARRKRSIACLSRTLILTLLLPCVVVAQSYRGSIRGKIYDPSGAVVPNAKVTAQGINTGLSRQVVTGPDRAYVLAELPALILALGVADREWFS